MLLCFTAIDSSTQYRHFSWWFHTPERAFDALSFMVAKGNQLIKAELIDGDQHLLLPIDAFDGQPFLSVIQELEIEWQAILNT